MKFLYGRGGATVPVIKDYELEVIANVIQPGEVLKCNADGKITQKTFDTTIGVAEEYHGGKVDILNPRSSGNKIRVNITADAVYSADAPRFVAAISGTDTLFVARVLGTTDLSNKVIGSTFVLVKKGENSQNTDEIGTARKVTDFSYSGNLANFTLESGGLPSVGDVYAAIPPVGFESAIGSNYQTISFGSGEGGKLKVVGNDIEKGTIDVIILETIFD